jgi:hypothetical protein
VTNDGVQRNTPRTPAFTAAWNTRTCIYKIKSVTIKRCRLPYTYKINCSSAITWTLPPHNKAEDNDNNNIELRTARTTYKDTRSGVAVLWLVQGESCDSQPYWHLLLRAGNTCLITESLVRWIIYRCLSARCLLTLWQFLRVLATLWPGYHTVVW